MNAELRLTEDGSHTLFVPEIDECYHSSYGAIQESKHIFIDRGLKFCSNIQLNVLEIGFGTGLNAFLTLNEVVSSGQIINYTALEKYPVEHTLANQLNYAGLISPEHTAIFEKIHSSAWNEAIQLLPNYSLLKVETDFTTFDFSETYDVIYFDAFSPEKQAEMWTSNQFEKLYKCCNFGAVLITYCAKGIVRRAMQEAGFKVERLDGPLGKRHVLRGLKAS